MLSDLRVNSPFGIPIYDVKIADFQSHQQALSETILAIRKKALSEKVSNQGGWHSRNNLHLSDNPEIRWLIKEIQSVSGDCIRHSMIGTNAVQLELSTCWANVNEAGDWNAPHAHFPADWSGVCYIQINRQTVETVKSDMDGDILLFNPLPLGPQYRRPPTINRRPQNGHILLFPSHLVHMVAPHFEKDPRISVAFNFSISPSKPPAKES